MGIVVDIFAGYDIRKALLSCTHEHIYQEAMDMDESVMTEHEERGNGNNVLFCYDC
jgi:hypothetical protein